MTMTLKRGSQCWMALKLLSRIFFFFSSLSCIPITLRSRSQAEGRIAAGHMPMLDLAAEADSLALGNQVFYMQQGSGTAGKPTNSGHISQLGHLQSTAGKVACWMHSKEAHLLVFVVCGVWNVWVHNKVWRISLDDCGSPRGTEDMRQICADLHMHDAWALLLCKARCSECSQRHVSGFLCKHWARCCCMGDMFQMRL